MVGCANKRSSGHTGNFSFLDKKIQSANFVSLFDINDGNFLKLLSVQDAYDMLH